MNNEIENKMTESDASSDCIENTCVERDNIIRGLLFNRTVNVIAVSGREIVETAREIHVFAPLLSEECCSPFP